MGIPYKGTSVPSHTAPVGTPFFKTDTKTHYINTDGATEWTKVIFSTDIVGGIDTDAIHDNIAGEINAVASKGTPVGADVLILEDSAAAFVKKKATLTSLVAAAPPAAHTHLEADITDLSHTDTNAIHDNVASEISAVTLKGTPVSGDLLLIEDSAAANAKKRITIGSLPTGSDDDAIHDNVASEISAITEKAVPVVGDHLLIEDSAAGNVKKRVTWGSFLGAIPAPILDSLVDDSVDAKTGTSYTTVAALTFTPPVAGDYLVVCYFELNNSNTGKVTDGQLTFDGVEIGHAFIDVGTVSDTYDAKAIVRQITFADTDPLDIDINYRLNPATTGSTARIRRKSIFVFAT